MSIISMILVVFVAFLAGMEGILDEFQFHQPLVACTLIGLVTGNLEAGIVLGGQGIKGVPSAIAIAVPLAVAGLFLTMIVRTIAVHIVHLMDAAAEEGNIRKVEMWHIIAVCLQGVRIAVPAGALLFIPAETVRSFLESMPAWLTDGMAIGGGMVVAVGYALVINMMATKEVWPFFVIGFVVAAISQLTLIALGALGVALALIYLNLSKMGGSSSNGGGSNSGDPLGDILNDY
ncbi:MAG: PTS mannose/fructose/sorbose transporter subunit IIC [Enterococcus lacertideformus]|uniref:PTS mannose/fructose/sorbose transporter subunit IIC n=1 Tax=Enterococcus lacertideformus TaxID=2771493 RepID=A0A931AZH4_9ENTE|nr:PTS mannose/fructose/sorbose transporter subunit IIC [Enterococcus lacertideformus]